MIDEAIRKYDSDYLALSDPSPTLNILGLPILKRSVTSNIIVRVKYLIIREFCSL